MDQLLSVTIAIPAFNEGTNIRNILSDLLKQKERGFSIKEIVVLSDGSTDNTVSEAKSVKDSRIKVIEGVERRGKVLRMNEIFEMVESDILVNFDADTRLADHTVVKELVTPILFAPDTAMVSGLHKPTKPKTFIERLAYFGVEVWDDSIKSLGQYGELYYATGQIRAFSKSFYKKFQYPDGVFSSEDAYIFMLLKNLQLKTVIAINAAVYFRLPSTLKDYLKQMKRFLKTEDVIRSFFPETLTDKYYTMTSSIKLSALVKRSIRTSPLVVVCYLLLQSLAKFQAMSHKQIALWQVADSSKKV